MQKSGKIEGDQNRKDEAIKYDPREEGNCWKSRALGTVLFLRRGGCKIPLDSPKKTKKKYFVIVNYDCTCFGEELKAKAPPKTNLVIYVS